MKKLFIVFAILCLAAPAMAADWNFYGSARFATFYVMDDYDISGAAYEDDDDLQWAQQGNSRIGANVKFNDQIGGGFEMSDSFGKRKLFGTYTFGGGSQLLIGQTYTPSALFYSNSVYDGDGDLLGVGEFYEGRVPMIQWKMGGLKIALIQPTEDGVGDEVVDVTLPKMEIGYGFKADMFFVDAFAGYQTYSQDGGNGGTDYDFDSYVVGLGGGMNFGALYIKVNGHMGQNLGNYGGYNPLDFDDAAVIDGTEVKDTDAYGLLGVIGFNASEMLTFEGGIGYVNYEKDVTGTEDETGMQYYVNAVINIAPGFFIVPEIGYIQADYDNAGEATDPNPSRTYFGAKWQINF
jgi:hypothetical protein